MVRRLCCDFAPLPHEFPSMEFSPSIHTPPPCGPSSYLLIDSPFGLPPVNYIILPPPMRLFSPCAVSPHNFFSSFPPPKGCFPQISLSLYKIITFFLQNSVVVHTNGFNNPPNFLFLPNN